MHEGIVHKYAIIELSINQVYKVYNSVTRYTPPEERYAITGTHLQEGVISNNWTGGGVLRAEARLSFEDTGNGSYTTGQG